MNDQYSPTQFGAAPDPDLFTRPNAGDDQLFVVFYMGVVKNEARTIEEGRAIYDDVECVRIVIPGDKNLVNDRPASPQDKRRFAKQYEVFKQGKSEDEQISGTRLTEWPFLSRAQVEELHYLGIRTVEQLANMRDDISGRVPGMVSLKQNAAVWLAKATKSAEAAQMTKQMQDQDAKIAELDMVVREQASRIEELLRHSKKVSA